MSSSMTSNGQREEIQICFSNSEQVKNYAKRFLRGHWTFLGPGDEKKWYGTLSYTPEEMIPQPHRWWDDSKKPFIQYSRVAVL